MSMTKPEIVKDTHRSTPVVSMENGKGGHVIVDARAVGQFEAKGWTVVCDSEPAKTHAITISTGEQAEFVNKVIEAGQANLSAVSKAELVDALGYLEASLPDRASKSDLLAELVRLVSE